MHDVEIKNWKWDSLNFETRIGAYRWIENWASIPPTPLGRKNGRTHGIVVADGGERIIVFHQAVPSVLIYDSDGRLISSWGDFPGAHGMTITRENGAEYLWLTDEFSSRVVKTTLDGELLLGLPGPRHPDYVEKNANYIPTWAAENPATGEVWVGDGYGASLVHRFSPEGKYEMTIDGTEGAGRFREPHGVNIMQGKQGLELFITDRASHRIVAYDTGGRFLRQSRSAHSPCCFDFLDEYVLVPELFTGVKILDRKSLNMLAEFGASGEIGPRADGGWWPPRAPDGWPNLAGSGHIKEGIFNSPHGAAFAPNGDIYVVEWIVGGRITKLEKL